MVLAIKHFRRQRLIQLFTVEDNKIKFRAFFYGNLRTSVLISKQESDQSRKQRKW